MLDEWLLDEELLGEELLADELEWLVEDILLRWSSA